MQQEISEQESLYMLQRDAVCNVPVRIYTYGQGSAGNAHTIESTESNKLPFMKFDTLVYKDGKTEICKSF